MSLTVTDAVADPVQHLASACAKLRAAAPRVQCLTNTVAQAFTANCLHALGVRASMATHPAEVLDMTLSADAVLINLGTLDAARVDAMGVLLDDPRLRTKPLVLDPVFVQVSALRAAWMRRILALDGVIVKGNADEMRAVRDCMRDGGGRYATLVTTGVVDRIEHWNGSTRHVAHGHAYMAQVTGLGCAAGAAIAAFAVIERDLMLAAATALTAFGIAGERAAAMCSGPGSFAVAFIDQLANLDKFR